MFKFIKETLREIDHVVWPTKADTRKYFMIVTIMIVTATIVLSIIGLGLTRSLFAIRAITPHEVALPVDDADSAARTQKILDSLKNSSPRTNAVSGAAIPRTASGTLPATSTGSTTSNK